MTLHNRSPLRPAPQRLVKALEAFRLVANALSYPPAEQPKLPANFEAETWAKLEDAVDAVHGKRTVACSLEELYRVRPGPPMKSSDT